MAPLGRLPGSQPITDPEYNHSPFDLAFYAFENPPNVYHSIPTTPAHLAVLILTPECLKEANTMTTYDKIGNFLSVDDHEKKIIYFLAGNNEDESFKPGNLVEMNMFLRTCFEYQGNMCPVVPLVEPQFLMHDILLKASYPKEHFCVLDKNGHLQHTLGEDDVFIWDCTHTSLSSNQVGSHKRKLEYRKREIKEYLARGSDLAQRELLNLFGPG
ncbi:hypothetical protein N7493_006839 [Penicillium malachiteum]|uniref:Uncharacterized protein n=1 Tax=Penicillium malachiteum TaxID=1324776 RepID=A0AAD6HJG2_9EURO|nr:hypothetical protein N7493_006839 [Penicillium malachiteum]